MKEIIHYMISGKMTFRKLLLWLAVIPLVGVCWMVFGIAYKAFMMMTYVYDHLPSFLPLIFK